MTQSTDEQFAEYASHHLDQLADEIQRYNPHLQDARFSIALTGPLTDVLIAYRHMIAAIKRLPSEEAIAYEMTEADAMLIARVTRLCADAPLAKLEAARLNVELHDAGRVDDAQGAYRQSRYGSNQAARDVGRSNLISMTGRYWRRARNWIKAGVDRHSATPARKF